MLDSQYDAKVEVCKVIRNQTKKEFRELTEMLKEYTDKESEKMRIEDASVYIQKNWSAAKRRLWRRDGIFACSAEGHVSHVLASRMSTQAMGWSRIGASKMARLREWYYNKESMLELVRNQKKEMPLAAGAEEIIASAEDILKSEKDTRTKIMRETARYAETMQGSLEIKTKRQLSFYINRWI